MPSRFISIHTQAEADLGMHLQVARRGAWIEYDGKGLGDDVAFRTTRPCFRPIRAISTG